MKRIKLFVLLLILFIPFMIEAKTCEDDKISIDSITVEEKNGEVVEVEQARVNDKKIVLNISMSDVGDKIKYKIIVKNESKDDYELSKENFNIDSDYIDYSVLYDDNSSIIKSNSTKVIYLEAEYKNEVPDNVFESGLFNENQKVSVNLLSNDLINDSTIMEENNDKKTEPDIITNPPRKDLNSNQIVEKNPETSVQSYIIIIFLGLTISIIIYVILRKKKYSTFMILIFGLIIIIIPISVYALCKCDIEVEIKVKIEKKYPLASQLLIINPDGENKEEKSPYVLYPSKKGDLLCRVLYDKNSQYGLQMVTDNPVDYVTLGKDDPNQNVIGTGNTRAGNSYNRAVMTLNEKALEYLDTYEIARDARSIGSLPDNKNYPDYLTGTERTSLYWQDESDYVEYSQIYTLRNKFFKGDENSTSDVAALKQIDSFSYEDSSYPSYWLASRSTFSLLGVAGRRHFVAAVTFYIEKVTNLNNYTSSDSIIHFNCNYNNQAIVYYSVTNGFRPVFIINDNVIITEGNGTKESPYVLSIPD